MPDLIVSGTLRAGVQVQLPTGVKSLDIYASDQVAIQDPSETLEKNFLIMHADSGLPSLTVQTASFPIASDNFWMVNRELRKQMAGIMANNSENCYFQLSYSFGRSLSSAASSQDKIKLTQADVNEFVRILLDSNHSEKSRIVLDNVFNAQIFINSAGNVKTGLSKGNASRIDLTFNSESGGDSLLGSWSIHVNSDSCTDGVAIPDPDDGTFWCRPRFEIASQKAPPGSTKDTSSTSGASTVTVTSLYIGIVYTIGRFLRMVFHDSHKRIIWEELPDTELLLDLCDGIYIARIEGVLGTEHRLYYELIRIFRTPELLHDVTGDFSLIFGDDSTDSHSPRRPRPTAAAAAAVADAGALRHSGFSSRGALAGEQTDHRGLRHRGTL
jgi:hypothetical protein